MNISEEKKKEILECLKTYGIFIGLITFLFLVIVGMSILSQKSLENGLRKNISVVLEEKFPSQYEVKEFKKINSTISYSSAVYHLKSVKGSDKNYAVVVRTNTFFGPVSSLFLYNLNSGSSYVGVLGVNGRVKKILESSKASVKLNYWNNRIPEIIEKAEINDK